MVKRSVDLIAALLGVILLSPLLLGIALWIKLDSPGGVLFRQDRVGRYGGLFKIHKFRTMFVGKTTTSLLTVGRDPRITRAGLFLRKYKLDELPQLLDVIAGNMSLVGPRPEVPKYVDCYPADMRKVVLSVRPGITDNASLEFFEENTLLASSPDPEKTYINEILPRKLALYKLYVEQRTLFGDLTIIARTLAQVVKRR